MFHDASPASSRPRLIIRVFEVIIVDDGSSDRTYEAAHVAVRENRSVWPNVYGKVVRHGVNLGKAEAIRTGVNKATGELVATVDADTWWEPNALCELVVDMESSRKVATSGYIHPSDGQRERRLFIILQQLEYSQGLSIYRSAYALGNAVLVVPGPMGVYKARVFRDLLNEKTAKSVTEDLETTLEMQARKLPIGYAKEARSNTVAPTCFKDFWNQRLRWFTGGLHNFLAIHKKLLYKKSWLALALWYALWGYVSGIIELAALFALPVLVWFAPDRTFFLLSLLVYAAFSLLVGIIYQGLALKFSYGKYNHKHLLFYTPLHFVLRLINVCARAKSLAKYLKGDRGCWTHAEV